jgi:hypothetical protein
MAKINKAQLIEMLMAQAEKELQAARDSAQETYEAVTNEESKPENEYDTRAIEASYLAMAQSKRISELEELVTTYKFVQLKDFTENDPIGPSALVEVSLNNKISFVFLLPKGGGHIVNFRGSPVQIITPSSPLGEALLGLKVGDGAVVETNSQTREYEILSVQ